MKRAITFASVLALAALAAGPAAQRRRSTGRTTPASPANASKMRSQPARRATRSRKEMHTTAARVKQWHHSDAGATPKQQPEPAPAK